MADSRCIQQQLSRYAPTTDLKNQPKCQSIKDYAIRTYNNIFLTADHQLFAHGNDIYDLLGSHSESLPSSNSIEFQPVLKEIPIQKILGIGMGGYWFSDKDDQLWRTGFVVGTKESEKTVPVVVPNIKSSEVKQMYSIQDNTFFIKNDGTIYGIGRNDHGQLGVGDQKEHDELVLVRHKNESEVTGIFNFYNITFFAMANGQIAVSGNLSSLGLSERSLLPLLLKLNMQIKQIQGLFKFTLFLNQEGTVFACGSDIYCGLTREGILKAPVENPIELLKDVVKIVNAYTSIYFLHKNGDVSAYNLLNYSEDRLKYDRVNYFSAPIKDSVLHRISALKNIVEFHVHGHYSDHFSALDNQGNIYSTILNDQIEQIRLPKGAKAVKIQTGSRYGVAQLETGELFSFGLKGLFPTVLLKVDPKEQKPAAKPEKPEELTSSQEPSLESTSASTVALRI